ncbi:MAG: hypothetical protein A3K10_17505 [Bacteroidetes bacterium RIFCSPLOWO2_12_FULL_31_6]|nr:MAG: hypothetical protein A3K10_17505 [Bacteroidetes bacterium RIFCSPLOWO2_12_FULL_31_6]
MKKIKLIGLLMILTSSLMFIQCTSSLDEGPQGVAGVDGTDGTDGVDGVDGTASCVACHNESHREPIKASYELSKHGMGAELSSGENSGSCTQCHTSQGYIDYVTNGSITGSAYPDANQTIRCTTCHDMHSTFDFANDGQDFALRNISPVKLVIDPTTSIDFGSTSNNCVTCHQPRNSYPVPAGTGTITITSYRYGPHHGPQSTMLEGIMGANVVGATAYPVPGSATHRTGASCTKCHMNSTTAGEGLGKHSMNVKDEAGNYVDNCVKCHTSGVPAGVTGYAADLQTLKDLLVAKKYISSETGYVLGANGTSNAGNTNQLVIPAKDAQAIWNYKTLIEDNSDGIHNPGYAKALLKNSIQALQ